MKGLLADIINFICPAYCIECEERLEVGHKHICAHCFAHLSRYDEVATLLHPWDKLEGHTPFSEYQSDLLFAQGSTVRALIHRMKYNGFPEIGTLLARHYAEEHKQKGHFKDCTVIVPIPLEKSRLRKRGYNQSYYIARGLAEVLHLPIEEELLTRRRGKGTQTHRKKEERWRAMKELFEVPTPTQVAGRRILLVDDVLTTGATLVHASKALARAGAESISYYTLAVDVLE